MKQYADLPFASTLCGSCTSVCPVKIDIHNQLYQWRQELAAQGHVPAAKKAGMAAMSYVLAHPPLYRFIGKWGRNFMQLSPRLFAIKAVNPWAKGREMPEAPKESFREWYQKNRKKS